MIRCVCVVDLIVISAVDQEICCVSADLVALDAGEVLVIKDAAVIGIVVIKKILSCCPSTQRV